MTEHTCNVDIRWAGNMGEGTSHYRAYKRDYLMQAGGKPDIAGSSDPAFLGDPARCNPGKMLLGALSACHKLWYLHLCAVNHITVTEYADHSTGYMTDSHPECKGHFTHVILRPGVTVTPDFDKVLALRLHEEVHHECFIANSVNFSVSCEAEILKRAC